MSKVYFAGLSSSTKEDNFLQRIERLFRYAGEGTEYDGGLVAIKLHFGELGIDTYMRPVRVRPIVEAVKKAGGKPFLADSNTLYRGSRGNSVDHHITAARNGWLMPVVDAPVIIADGLHGNDFRTQKIDGKHFKEVKIASGFYHADAIVGVTHFKGHDMTGFGGTLKNLGMGCASRAGKLMMHFDVKPVVDRDKCVACGRCATWCPADAIEVKEYASIDLSRCVGCGECRIVCHLGAVKVKDYSGNDDMQEKIAEFAHGTMMGKYEKSLFYNFVLDVTPECDCPPWRKGPLVADIGVLASRDPVAVDQAAFDLVKDAKGTEHESGMDKFCAVHKVDGEVQLVHGERLGMGERRYELVDITKE